MEGGTEWGSLEEEGEGGGLNGDHAADGLHIKLISSHLDIEANEL